MSYDGKHPISRPCWAAKRRPGVGARALESSITRRTLKKTGNSLSADFDKNSFTRIDRAHASGSVESKSENREEPADEPSAWLHLEAVDLIAKLQQWEAELDAREAQLNVRSAIEEHRERQFRVEQQSAIADLAEQSRAMERIEAELRSRARRLAFE